MKKNLKDFKAYAAFVITAAVVFTAAPGGLVFAASIEDQLDDKISEKGEVDSALDDVKEEIDRTQQDIDDANQNIDDAEKTVTLKQEEAYLIIGELETLRDDINAFDSLLKALEQQYKEKELLFLERAKTMYQYSEYNVIDIFFSSSDLLDFVGKLDTFLKMLNEDRQLLEEIKSMQEQMEIKKKQGELLLRGKEELLAQIDAAITEINENMTVTRAQYGLLISVMAELQAQEKELNDRSEELADDIDVLKEEASKTPEPTPTPTSAPTQTPPPVPTAEPTATASPTETAVPDTPAADPSDTPFDTEIPTEVPPPQTATAEQTKASAEATPDTPPPESTETTTETPTAAPGSSSDIEPTSPEECDFAWPLPEAGYYLTSFFGYRIDPFTGVPSGHSGTDIAMAEGTPIYAAQSGVVEISTTNGGGYGYYIQIRHDNGVKTLYAHCSKLLVKVGQRVSKGDKIALVGSSGRATGPHLHFEVIVGGTKIEPLPYLPRTILLDRTYNWSTDAKYSTMLLRIS